MKATILITIAILAASSAIGQFQYKKKFVSGGQVQHVEWIDLNNDSFLDAVLSVNKNGVQSLVVISKVASDTNAVVTLADSIPAAGFPAFLDWNGDNKIDVIFPAHGNDHAVVLLNLGNFSFQRLSLTFGNQAYSTIRFADMNNDGRQDAVATKTGGGWTILRNDRSQFSVVADSSLQADDVAVFDFDKNGFPDIALSGTASNGQPVLFVYTFYNNFQLARKIIVPTPVHGKIEMGDVNEDGFFDLFVSGKSISGELASYIFTKNDSTFTFNRKYLGLQNPELKVADFNSDGLADLSFFGQDINGNVRHWISTATNDSIALPEPHITHQAYGDYDRDGDLDLLMSTDTLSIVLFENMTPAINKGPFAPANLVTVVIFNRIFSFWQKAFDDHTPSPTLTYDVSIGEGAQQVESGAFDLVSFARLSATHGNHGTNNFSLLHVPINPYALFIQSIDNSFTANPRNICRGGGSGKPCVNMETQTLTTCQSTPIHIKEQQPVMWFSFSQGYLGTADSVTASAKTDTLFSFLPASMPTCNNIKVFLINRSAADTITLNTKIEACIGVPVVLGVAPEWTGIVWKDSNGRALGSGDTLHIVADKSQMFTVSGHNARSCILRETENLIASKPSLKLNGQDFKIMLGQQVTLEVSGAQSYLWQPPDGLSSTTSASPVAVPTKTTQYTVTGKDSLGCSASANVLVEVAETGFVPTLFTPNGDGKNDVLLVYGLANTKQFEFTIYTRDGSVVFSTSDLNLMSLTGWDGTKNGVPQQTGLYYWRVGGHFDNGGIILLDGKTTGSVLLLR